MTLTRKILLLNGPKRSGKDTLGRAIARLHDEVGVFKFAGALKAMTHGAYGITHGGLVVDDDYFEDRKDQPCEEFYGITPRHAYIAMSERLMKPMHGQSIFGELLRKVLHASPFQVAVVTDSGFRSEAEVLIEEFGRESVFLVHLHRLGHTFAGDSRSFIDLDVPPENKMRVQNDGTLDDLRERAQEVLRRVLR